MEDFVKYNALYDCYKELLTEKECNTFEDYYFDNLSMQEIADNNGVSKSAIHKILQTAIEKLDLYESKLELNKKYDLLKEALSNNDITEIKNTINKVIN